MTASARARASHKALLPVPQVRDSHDLHLDPLGMPDTGLVVAPSYDGMAEGDAATFTFTPANGMRPWVKTYPITDDNLDQPLSWGLPLEEAIVSMYETADFGYVIKRGQDIVLESEKQTLMLDSTATPLQPAVQLADGPDTTLDPSLYPDGLTVVVPLYTGAALDDWVMVYWKGIQNASSTVMASRISQTELDAGQISLLVDPRWLTSNTGSNVDVSWQYARQGEAQSSSVLKLNIVEPLKVPPPRVEHAEAEGGGGENRGYLEASKAADGVFISVPESLDVSPADTLRMHWDGHPAGGKHVAEAPYSDAEPRRFHVPRAAVPANIGGEAKRMPVYYTLTLASGRMYRSDAFHLHVRPYPDSAYAPPQCPLAHGKPGLALQDVPEQGALLHVTGFPLSAEGHLLSVWITGLDEANGEVHHMVREAEPVTTAELEARSIGGVVSRAVLQTLKTNFSFILHANVSYDGGDTTIRFRTASVLWLG